MSTPTAVTDPVAAPGSPKRPRGLLGAVAGSTMEVFDFTIYNTFAPFFAAAFFVASPGNTTGAFLQSLAVLAVGFIARPLGSLLFGHISDTRGRRVSLYLTSLTALLGTLLIALSPTHDTIGIGAAIVLVSARIIQGLAHGGEQPAAGAYVAEVATPRTRGAWSAWVYMSIMAGGALATLLGALLSSTVGAEALRAWAWRVPFFVGALGSVVALYLVWRLHETEVFTETSANVDKPSVWAEMWAARRPALQIIGLTIGLTIAFQNWAAIGGYHIAVFHSNPAQVLWVGVVSQVLAIGALPLWGRLSDRIGRKPVTLIGFVGLALTTYPFMAFLDGSWQRMALTMVVSFLLLSAPLSIAPALMAELVPTSIRTIGVGFSYALATAVFGGTVPFLQTWISSTWGPQDFGLYVTAALVVSIVVALRIPETRGKDLAADATTASDRTLTPAAHATKEN